MSADRRRLIVALDFPQAEAALQLVASLQPGSCRLKVGKELFVAAGPDLVRQLLDRGFEVFLDLKFHDIPSTVAGACRAAAALGAWMLTVHVCGGRAMLEAAREAVAASSSPPLLVGVTVLTSLDRESLAELGLGGEPTTWVQRWSALAVETGLDGIVCSPNEVAMVRAWHGSRLLRITPGIRPQGTADGDQKRIATPGEALAAGADYLVVGRPVIRAADPAGVIRAILSEMSHSQPPGDSLA